MNSVAQAKQIYQLCVDSAMASRTLTYGAVLNSLGYDRGVPGYAIRYGLELVLIACRDRELPGLTSIVVNESTGRPSVGGYPQDRWDGDVQGVFAHQKWPPVDEVDWEYVWKNRRQLSNMHGTPGYWDT
jgi:hypothetical protein